MISPIQECPSVESYLSRIGAVVKTLFTAAIVIEAMGYQKEIYSIRFNRDGDVFAPAHLTPTEEEKSAIREEVSSKTFPNQEPVSALSNANMPELMLRASSEDLFIFKDSNGNIPFVQVRVDLDNGDKRYIPQTYWSDGEWRPIEPEDGMPIYGLENVERGDRVFLHEGAKAAKAAQLIANSDDHPWSSFFSTGKHVGWCGGAHYVGKTKWKDIRSLPAELIIVPDNDFVGRSKVKQLSARFNCPTRFSLFDNAWPPAWDVADPMPDSFFAEDSGLYIGPDFIELLHPCDWATEQIGVAENGKPIFGIREEFAQNWVRVQKLRHYVHIQNPELTLDKEQFNVAVRPFSHVIDTAASLATMSGNIVNSVTFLPDRETGLVYEENELRLNQYVDRRIKPSNGGETAPFWEFMEYMFPESEERKEVVKWMATLYAKPSVRMEYAMLFLSKLQGVGKSTLLAMMADMIGKRHVSFPGDAMVQSDFNTWLVNKRLVVIHEIYAGQNWKTYNRLKSLITDETIEANSKHVANYSLPNYTHFAAASNSLEALRIEHDDRRWYVPRLPEHLYDNYSGLRKWLRAGGLKYLADEFCNQDEYVKEGDRAPLTKSKVHLIEQSMPPDERLVISLAQRLMPTDCLDINDIWIWLQQEARSKAYVTPQRISSLLKEKGFFVEDERKIGSRPRWLLWASPEAAHEASKDKLPSEIDKAVMARLREPSKVFSEEASM